MHIPTRWFKLMLELADAWVWDFWFADDGENYHCFYLHAPRSLVDAERRHRAARIGHATSRDLSSWRVIGDVFPAGETGSFDETATWTGSVVRGDDGLWRMYYTGTRFLNAPPDHTNIESIGVAVSSDLQQWHKRPGPVTSASPRWYETLGTSDWVEEAWRDPWVFRTEDGVWHMLVTARSNSGELLDRGVVGHALSNDLESWQVQRPLSAPAGFGHLEVLQLAQIDGTWQLLFSCSGGALSARRAFVDNSAGIWSVPVDDPDGPFPIEDARPLTDERLYSGKAMQRRDGRWVLLGFANAPPQEPFPGTISDPIPLSVAPDGRLRLTH